MRLDLTESEERAGPLRNPLTNGALLLDLALLSSRTHRSFTLSRNIGMADKLLHKPPWKSPQSVSTARRHVATALQTLGLIRLATEHGHQGMSVIEAVLQGNMQVVWGIVRHVMTALGQPDNAMPQGVPAYDYSKSKVASRLFGGLCNTCFFRE